MENNKTAENQVSFETEMTSIALDKSVEKKNFSFEEKVPKLVNITNKRGEKSEIITSSPYKRKLKKDQWKNQLKIKSEFVQFVKVAGGTARWTGLSVECVMSGCMETVQ